MDSLGAQFEVERLLEAGDRVVWIASTVGAGDASGAPVTQRWGQVYTFRDGEISEVDNYWEAKDALKPSASRSSRTERPALRRHQCIAH